MRTIVTGIAAFAGVCAAWAAGCTTAARLVGLSADAMYVNGVIVTMDAAHPSAQAVAVRRDEIVAVGSNDEVRRLAGPETAVVDLAGKVMVPGFYAAHDHFPGSGMVAVTGVDLNSPPIGKITQMSEIVSLLKERATKTPKGQWVLGRGYDDTLVKEMRHPTRQDLDAASTDHPIWITHISGHLGVANTVALGLAGVTRTTKNPEGGVIRRDANGEPDGVFEEVGHLVARLIPAPSRETTLEGIKWAVRDYVEEGVTTASVTGGTRDSLMDLQAAERAGILDLRVNVYAIKAEPGQPSAVEAGGLVTGFGGKKIKVQGIKMVQDGSIQGYTGYLVKPYHVPFKGDTGYRGYPRRSRAALTAMVKEAHRAGYQIAIHGNGDAAIDDILDAYAEALKELPRPDHRHRIEHSQMARDDQIDRMKELGVTPSFFVGHVYYWGDRHRDIFQGPDRGSRISPLASAVARGVTFTIHDDTPVTPVRPLQLVWDAVNRLTTSGKVLGPDQRIGVERALRAVTLDAAWQNLEETTKGSIEVGKLADFVVLAENPLTVEPTKIRDIQVLETIVGGKSVYKRQSATN